MTQTPHLLVFAKHDCCDKEYLFAVPYFLAVEKGDILIVDTKKGLTVATATSDMFEGKNIDEIAVRFGAYLPLKEVKQVAGKMLRTYIARKERNEILRSIQIRDDRYNCYELPY